MTSKKIKDEFFDDEVSSDFMDNQYLESPQKQNLVATSQINTIVKPKRKYKKKKETLSPFIRLRVNCSKDLVYI